MRRDENDGAARPLQLFEGDAAGIERPHEVYVDDGLKAIERKIFALDEKIARSAADQNVDVAESVAGHVHC